jgi:hypothetical protein
MRSIRLREDAGARWPSTYTIVADVFQIERDADGNRLCSDTQHGAVKRALASLQRKGLIIGFRDTSHGDGRIELCHIWMTEAGLARWLARQEADAAHSKKPAFAADVAARAMVIAKRAKAMGMSLPEDARER